MSRTEEIHALLREHAGARGALSDATDLYADLGLLADDLEDFMLAFAARFAVDLSGFRWYFHTDEDGISPGRLLFAAPQDRVTWIPLTVGLLRQAAELGRWPVDYPAHSFPARRCDILVNRCLAACICVAVLWWLAAKLL